MTKNERKILSACKKISNAIISTTDIQQHLNLDKFQIADCCDYLNQNAYFELYSKDLNQEVKIKLSYKGIHYSEINFIEFKNFLFKSVVVPIIVSFITTVLYLWLVK